MGYVFCTSPCLCCGRLFSYNVHRVPSFRTRPDDASSREPVCLSCMAIINVKRKEKGLAPFVIFSDAYEAIPEEEL